MLTENVPVLRESSTPSSFNLASRAALSCRERGKSLSLSLSQGWAEEVCATNSVVVRKSVRDVYMFELRVRCQEFSV